MLKVFELIEFNDGKWTLVSTFKETSYGIYEYPDIADDPFTCECVPSFPPLGDNQKLEEKE